ncbi:hypothetical protein [Streptomyces sp. ODS28]|uniref:hypothetical protein n=1 Tax=Streptomyces sp. ODS28 TaxID=3136688 RepID=UPI0031EE9ADD
MTTAGTGRGRGRTALVLGLVVVVCGAALGLGHWAGEQRGAQAGARAFTVRGGDGAECGGITPAKHRAALRRAVPAAHVFGVYAPRGRLGAGSRECRIYADGGLALSVRTQFSPLGFGQWASSQDRGVGRPERRPLDAADGGYSTRTSAGVYVKCPGAQGKAVTVAVRIAAGGDGDGGGDGGSEDHRRDVVALAEEAAGNGAEVGEICDSNA